MKAIIISTSCDNFRSNELDKYLNDIRRYKPLSIEDEIKFAQMAHKGDKNAEKAMINANLAFVVTVAKHYQGCGLDLLDLINEGNIGLCKAVKDFDETLGFKFISFAVSYIRQEIMNAINENARLVRLPLNAINEKQHSSAISFNTPLGDGNSEGERTLEDTFASDSRANTYDHTQAVEHKVMALLANITDREKEIICRLFGIGCTEQSEYTLAKRYNLCEERIRQIKWDAIEKMRELV